MKKISEDLKAKHRSILIQEAMSGEIQKDILPDSALDFSGELIANYSARTRIFLDSFLAHMIMYDHRDNISGAYKIRNRGECYGAG